MPGLDKVVYLVVVVVVVEGIERTDRMFVDRIVDQIKNKNLTNDEFQSFSYLP